MGESLIPVGVKEIGAFGLVALFFVLFYTGRIVAGRVVDRLEAQANARADQAVIRAEKAEAAAEAWRGIAETNAEAVGILTGHVREQTEVGRLTGHLLDSLKTVTGPQGGVGSPQVGEGLHRAVDG